MKQEGIYTPTINIRLSRCLITSIVALLTSLQLSSQCTEDVNFWAESWTSCVQSPNPNPSLPNSHWILYEFDEAIEITGTHIWNANKNGQSSSGLKDVIIHVTYDGLTWNQIANSSFLWPKAPESNSYLGFSGPALNEHGLVTKVLITCQTTHGAGNCASIAEIKFDVNPDACDGILDACNVCNGPGEYTYYLDADNDGLGNPNMSIQACEFPEEGYVSNASDDCDTGGWEQMGLLFDSNGCTGCHNATSPSGLNLLSYEGFMNGGSKCGQNLQTGTTLVDIIMIEGYSGCTSPIQGLSMNDRVGGAIDDLELMQIQSWINSGAPEFDCPICPVLTDELIGTACDDADPCTDTSIYSFDCECAARTNVALAGIPSMSSVYNSDLTEVHLNDGILNSGLSATSDSSPNEWVEIDLGSSAQINEVVIWNRTGCCQDRLNNTYILISDAPFPMNTDLTSALNNATFVYQLSDASGVLTVPVNVGMMGRYVRLQKSGDNGNSNIINIQEFQVFGQPVFLDSDNDGICDAIDQCPNVNDNVIGTPCDDNDQCTINDEYDSNCDCSGTFADTDADGVCDALDQCPNVDDNLIGTPCNDNDQCTINDEYDSNCDCSGTFADADADGVCDADDVCNGGDDNEDSDGDGTPDFCDTDCTMIMDDDFETNSSVNWTSGGIDAELVQSTNSPAGNYSYRIRDNTFEASSISSAIFDLSQTDLLYVNFDFQAISMEPNEVFYLEMSTDGGSSFSIIQEWISGTDFVNNQIYSERLDILGGTLSANTIFRFRCHASINSDEVYLDNIEIETCDNQCLDMIIETLNDQVTVSKSANIGIESNQIVPTNSDIEFTAGESVLMTAGFEVKPSALFHAYIEGCN